MTKKQQAKLTLIGESFAPWTKKARWALEFCGLAYEYVEYIPTLSEPGLRWRLKQLTGTVSVPILFADQEVFRGSWEIANYANATTGGERLGDFEEIEPWNDLSEAALAEGRTSVVRKILNSDRALEEGLPDFVPTRMRRMMRFMARDAVKRLDRKYAHLVQPGALRDALLRTRQGLEKSCSDYLLDRFSYADITMAVVLEVIAPIAVTQPPLGPETQKCWNDFQLANEFEDLVIWRNRLAETKAISFSQFTS